MDAVEAVMLEDGYAALSARSIARRAELNYQLVFYYFGTIDDLLVATYQRRIQRDVERVEATLESDQPLRAYWRMSHQSSDSGLSLEYMAMSKHYPAIREASIAHARWTQEMIAKRISQYPASDQVDAAVVTPAACGMAIALLGANIARQSALGIDAGVSETILLIEWCLDKLEPPPP